MSSAFTILRQLTWLALGLVAFYVLVVPRPVTVALVFADPRYADMACSAVAQVWAAGGHARLVELGGAPNATCDDVRRRLGALAPCAALRRRADDDAYQSMLARRLAYVARAVETAPPTVAGYLVLDADVVLGPRAVASMAGLGGDIVFTAEYPAMAGRAPINGGVWWVRARSTAAVALLREALRLMTTLRLPDQDALQFALRTAPPPLVWYLLGPPDYLNGFAHAVGGVGGRAPQLVHANWVGGRRGKLARLRALGVVGRFPACFEPADRVGAAVDPIDVLAERHPRLLCELVDVLGDRDGVEGRSMRNDSLRLAAQCYEPRACWRALHTRASLRRARKLCTAQPLNSQ